MKMPAFATKAGRLAGIDRAVGFALLGRGWSALAGIVTLALLVRFLSPYQQAYYSTFGSIMGLQIFFELGMGLVLMQFVSHERGRLEWTPQRTLTGDPVVKARLASLLRRGLFWYGLMSALVLTVIYPVGLIFFRFFQYHAPGVPPVAWQGPWLYLAIAVSGNLLFTPVWAVLEGCGLVAEVVRAQLVGAVCTTSLFWLLLLLHCGLYAAPAGGIAGTIWVVSWLSVRQRGFLLDLLRAARAGIEVSWRHEIWPFQWKIAVSWFAGYFITQTFTPLLFAFREPVLAARMGMTLGITTAIATIAISWISTKAAPFGSLVARREWAEMDRLFFPALRHSTLALALGEAAFWVLNLFLHHLPLAHRLSARLLDPAPLALLMGAVICAHIVGAESIYLRAHKQEPFLFLSLWVGGLTALGSWLLGRCFGVTGMMSWYFAVSATVGLGFGNWIFIQKRRQWHQEALIEPLERRPPQERASEPFLP